MTTHQTVPVGRNHEADPRDMNADFLLDLALELHARCCMWHVSAQVFNRSNELNAECRRRLLAAAPRPDDELARLERYLADRHAGEWFRIYFTPTSPERIWWVDNNPLQQFKEKTSVIRYIELRGLLERHPTEPGLVRIKAQP